MRRGGNIIKKLEFTTENRRIYGKYFRPEGEGPFPTVILSHGLGNTLAVNTFYASEFADHRIAAYVFDFPGGSRRGRSSGKTTEMSVLTEQEDLNTVLDGIEQLPETDRDNIFLMGESQGGFVSTCLAAATPDRVKGLILLYPAFVLQEHAIACLREWNDDSETVFFRGLTVGRRYLEDALSFDIYDLMQNYSRDVLILHGTADTDSPIACSERAVEIFPSARLVRIEGAAHGFYGEDEAKASRLAIQFVQSHL